jgi:ribose/xylose/arabinose/galactoside ABC-type transport system permease subunit
VALGVVVAGVLIAISGEAGDYLDNDRFRALAASLAMLAAPVALLATWDEFDLSCFGTAAVGSVVYSEVAGDSVLPGLLAAALAGVVVGALIGLIRWLTAAHSALVSLGAGSLLAALALWWGDGPQTMPIRSALIDGWLLPLLAMVVVTGAAIGLAVAMAPSRPGGPVPSRTPAAGGGRVPGVGALAGFALSGLAAGAFGAFQAGLQGVVVPGQMTSLLPLLFAAVAVGGVVRGSGAFGPVCAALGAFVVTVVQDAGFLNGWRQGEGQIALGALFVVSVVIAHGLRRLMAPRPVVGF